MKRLIILLQFLTIVSILTITSCKKWDIENYSTLKDLYKEYKDGSISECMYNGEIVYSAGSGDYDAASHIYDYDGNSIGICNWAWGTPDSICYQLEDCETIYQNITGTDPVDKYDLGK